MSKIHYFQRYSSAENVVTNNTLQLFARIYGNSPARLSQFLSALLDDQDIELGVEIRQQQKSPKSVPDGAITQRSFKLLLEAKVNALEDVNQLLCHAESFQGEEQQILLLLTKKRLADAKIQHFANAIRANSARP